MHVNTYSNISGELRAFFSSNRVFKILLPIDMILLFAGLAILFVDYFNIINFGGLIYSLAYWAFLLGLLLAYANLKEQFLYIGLLGYGAINALHLIITLFKAYHIFSWSSLINALIYGGLGYLVLKRTIAGSANTSFNR